MALNIDDMDILCLNNLDFKKNMFLAVFSFLDEYRSKNYKILIHCNQGESRGLKIEMLYLGKIGAFDYADFHTAKDLFTEKYPKFKLKKNIHDTVQTLWKDFVNVENK